MTLKHFTSRVVVCAILLFPYIRVVASWELRMRPQVSVIQPSTALNILCQSDSNTPLEACGFQVSHTSYYDVSQGALTPPQITPYYTLKYYGTGLERGQCGITLTPTDITRPENVGCRGRTETGGWKYDFMTFVVREENTLPFTVEPRHQVVVPGTTISILFHVDEPLTSCRIKPPSENHYVSFNNGVSSVATTHYRYHGDGLRFGHCGITINDVTEEDNEWVVFDIITQDNKIAHTTSLFPVAKPPTGPPELVLPKTQYKAGDMLEAQCTVMESRPPANITWYLGSEVVNRDNVKEVIKSRWRWKIDPESKTEKIQIVLTPLDDGKEVRCVVDHVGMRDTLRTSKRIQVARGSYTAIPDCGQRNPRPSLVAGGRDADIGEFSWHAGLYGLLRNKTYIQRCGGTLITPKIILTAAHCVYDEVYSRLLDKENYKVVLGKHLRDWYADLNLTSVQRRDVESIKIPGKYRGRRVDYRYDIAILKLTTPIIITFSVNVACIDWKDEITNVQLTTGNSGVAAGWGITSTGKEIANVLQWVNLPYVDSDTCHEATPVETQKYLTNDKFCAGYLNRNTSVCQGDSGGGLLFQDAATKRYFLRGVVSTNLVRDIDPQRCNSQLFTSFTSVADYVKWIKRNI